MRVKLRKIECLLMMKLLRNECCPCAESMTIVMMLVQVWRNVVVLDRPVSHVHRTILIVLSEPEDSVNASWALIIHKHTLDTCHRTKKARLSPTCCNYARISPSEH